MRFYLRIINPAIALVVLLLCTWAAIFNDKALNISGLVTGGFSTYFFAKGLFTCSTLFVLGKVLLELLYKNSSITRPKMSKLEHFYFIAFLTFTIGALAGLFFWNVEVNISKAEKYDFTNPAEISVTKYYPIKESEKLKIGVNIRNNSNIIWKPAKVSAKLYLGDKYSGKGDMTILEFGPNSNEEVAIDFNEFYNQNVKDSITCKFIIEANKGKAK